MLKSTLIEAAQAGAAEILRYFHGEFRIDNKEGVGAIFEPAQSDVCLVGFAGWQHRTRLIG